MPPLEELSELGHLVSMSPGLVLKIRLSDDLITFAAGDVRCILGYWPSELVESPVHLSDLICIEDHEWWRFKLEKCLVSSGGEFDQGLRLRHRDGTLRWLTGRVRVVCDESSQPAVVLGHFIDITSWNLAENTLDVTEQRAMQLELEQARMEQEQVDLNDRLLSHASHELRTPLSCVHEFLTLLRDGIGGERSAEHGKYVEIMLRNVLQLRVKIAELTDVARARMATPVVAPHRLQSDSDLEVPTGAPS